MAAKASRPKKVQRDVYLRRSTSQVRDLTPDSNDEMNSKKRLHSTRDSFTEQSRDGPDQSDVIGGEQDYGSPEPDNYAHKRSRPSDLTEWPLKSDISNNIDPRNRIPNLSGRPSAVSLHSGWRPESSYQHLAGRPSRFQEGSMNDRASKNPPSTFTEHYDAVGRYLEEQENVSCMADPNTAHSQPVQRDKVRRQQPSISQNSGGTADSQRSGIWRFGKAIVDWFNYSKYVQEEEEKARQKRVLERRQRKAMKIYEELKRTGQLGALGRRGTRSNVNVTAPSYHQTGWNRPSINNRDSGVDVDEGRHFDRQKGIVPSFDADQVLMPPPSLPVFDRSGAPSSVVSPPPRQSTFKRPSIPNLKKARSEVQLPSSAYSLQIAIPNRVPEEAAASISLLRKQPSKKDLQKQQKLSKKVSDLEAKLQAARRELSLALGEAVPVPPLPSSAINRKAFTVGTLPSLTSGDLAQGAGFDSEVNDDLGVTAGTVGSKTSTNVAIPQAPKASVAKKSSGAKMGASESAIKIESMPKPKKRKSAGGLTIDGNYKPGSDTDDDPTESKAPRKAPMRGTARPKKLQKISTVGGVRSAATEDKYTMQYGEAGSVTGNPQSDILPRAEADIAETTSVSVYTASPPESPSSSNLLSPKNLESKSQNPSIPPIPELPISVKHVTKVTSGNRSNKSANVDPKKRLQPEQPREPYEWPEDVF
ncbi:MAG: hypothetical protein M1840_000089 [Geoglossum simile]|nr:MAG: hypothetical protein M1840_000089 [Geoglossum simile]